LTDALSSTSAVDFHMPAGLLHEAVDRLIRPIAVPWSCLLGGEEGSKARSMVSLPMPPPVSLTEICTYWPQFDRELAALWRRVGRIDRKIKDRRFKPVLVALTWAFPCDRTEQDLPTSGGPRIL